MNSDDLVQAVTELSKEGHLPVTKGPLMQWCKENDVDAGWTNAGRGGQYIEAADHAEGDRRLAKWKRGEHLSAPVAWCPREDADRVAEDLAARGWRRLSYDWKKQPWIWSAQ